MFGELAEEKEVTALTRKIAEARNIKSYDTYAILARFVSPTILLALIKPLKDVSDFYFYCKNTVKSSDYRTIFLL